MNWWSGSSVWIVVRVVKNWCDLWAGIWNGIDTHELTVATWVVVDHTHTHEIVGIGRVSEQL